MIGILWSQDPPTLSGPFYLPWGWYLSACRKWLLLPSVHDYMPIDSAIIRDKMVSIYSDDIALTCVIESCSSCTFPPPRLHKYIMSWAIRSNSSQTVIADIPTHRPSCPPREKGEIFFTNSYPIEIIIDREGREIMYLVAFVRPSVRPSVRLSVWPLTAEPFDLRPWFFV